MIRRHDFNSDWWGGTVGIVDDAAFFQLDAPRQRELLDPFEWVEFRHDLASAPLEPAMVDAGFALLDVQVGFRMKLSATTRFPSSSHIEVVDATDSRFEGAFEELQDFEWERYLKLPGSDIARTNDRFVRWARLHVDRVPSHSLELRSADGVVQGWFLAEPDGSGVHLALAMRHASAITSGVTLYDAAFAHFGGLGARIGHAAFSVANRSALNLYSELGARFTSTTGCWFNVGHA